MTSSSPLVDLLVWKGDAVMLTSETGGIGETEEGGVAYLDANELGEAGDSYTEDRGEPRADSKQEELRTLPLPSGDVGTAVVILLGSSSVLLQS